MFFIDGFSSSPKSPAFGRVRDLEPATCVTPASRKTVALSDFVA
jgi:hypothetical protein